MKRNPTGTELFNPGERAVEKIQRCLLVLNEALNNPLQSDFNLSIPLYRPHFTFLPRSHMPYVAVAEAVSLLLLVLALVLRLRLRPCLC